MLFGDDAIAILLAVLGGLGVFAVADSETSDLEARSLARNAMDALEDAGTFVKDGALSVYTSVSEAWSYAVSTDLVQWLHNWLWNDSAVLGSSSLPDVTFDADIVNSALYNASLHAYAVLLDSPDCAYVAYADVPLIVTPRSDGGYDLKTEDGSSFYSWREVWNSWNFHSKTSWFSPGTIHYFGQANPSVTTTYDIALGTVAPPGTDIDTEYGEYIVIVAPNGVPDTGGDGGDDEQPKIPVLPVPYLPPNEIPNVPQEDIWKGNKVEIDNPDTGDTPDPTTGTDTDDPDSGSNNPTTPNPDPGTNPGTGVPSDIGKYQLDLKDFFPFCIPFDLYRFFEILCAEPEAPVFHWEFNVFGEIYSLDVDLSPWNPHAQLFRDAQVGLFIMGLLWITRKFIKW